MRTKLILMVLILSTGLAGCVGWRKEYCYPPPEWRAIPLWGYVCEPPEGLTSVPLPDIGYDGTVFDDTPAPSPKEGKDTPSAGRR